MRVPSSCLLPAWKLLLVFAFALVLSGRAQLPAGNSPDHPRHTESLAEGWKTQMAASGTEDPANFQTESFDDQTWKSVSAPHNWDTYAGYRHAKHGNTHGTAWYRTRFDVRGKLGDDQRVLLFFEGVGSYATVWVNGRKVGEHAGGLTTFTLDVTDAVTRTGLNLLAVRAEHPAGIRNLPWVCGGCERAYGFSEGSQPFGIFRPVHLIIANRTRFQPFGLHAWSDHNVSPSGGTLNLSTELINDGGPARTRLAATLLDREGDAVAQASMPVSLDAQSEKTVGLSPTQISPVQLWSLKHPHLYTVRVDLLSEAGELLDRIETPFGFRTISWPVREHESRGTFLLNGEPVFLNGTCEYQHLLGGSHAFAPEQVHARVQQMRAAGFNAFRDAHHPHDLRYNAAWDRHGLAWWTQFGAHIWFDREDFRANYLRLLKDWIRERRNSPSLVLWGLQNESQLPKEFAEECVRIIREMDPTAVDQRLVTTCNGGEGTDWDVPQNWSGTYGGDPTKYGEELIKQRLVGEYGAWRSADLGAEGGKRSTVGYDENYFNDLLNTKIKLASSVATKVAGHFQWLFTTHDNPGRNLGAKGEQIADGWSALDRIGPANNKGLLTLWGEPLDIFYIYRAHFIDPAKEPFVVIAGANRGIESLATPSRIQAFSNATEVELFDGLGGTSLGVRKKPAGDVVFTWDQVKSKTGVLHAVARMGERVVGTDTVSTVGARLDHNRKTKASTAASNDGSKHYLFRVNCGGPEYLDSDGNVWLPDQPFAPGLAYGSRSWTSAYPHLPEMLGSSRKIHAPIANTDEDPLYQDFRYGRGELAFVFSLPDGEYEIELHFSEPWYGRGNTDARGWRLFDVAVSGETVLRNVDLWSESGYATALVKTVEGRSKNGQLVISFPKVSSYQAVISGIAISRPKRASDQTLARDTPARQIVSLDPASSISLRHWLDQGDALFGESSAFILRLPEALRHQAWLQRNSSLPGTNLEFSVGTQSQLYAAWPENATPAASWISTGEFLNVFDPETEAHRRYPVFQFSLEAGGKVGFAKADAPALIVVAPVRPLAPPQATKNLQVVQADSPDANWALAGNLKIGARVRSDSLESVTKLPGELSDTDWIQTPAANSSQNLQVTFATTDHADVYVGFDKAQTAPPEWAKDWLPVTQEVSIGTTAYALRRKHFPSGSEVRLGSNVEGDHAASDKQAGMYLVLARPVRPVHHYAPRTDGASALLSKSGDTHQWEIPFGVGDRYGFVFKHRLPANAAAKVRYELIDLAGKTLCQSEHPLPPGTTTTDGWQYLRLRTCESFNAGTYFVRLTLLDGSAVELSSLTVE